MFNDIFFLKAYLKSVLFADYCHTNIFPIHIDIEVPCVW